MANNDNNSLDDKVLEIKSKLIESVKKFGKKFRLDKR